MVNVEGQQVADGVVVLSAIQPVAKRSARIGMCCGGLVELGFERVDEGGAPRSVGPGLRPLKV